MNYTQNRLIFGKYSFENKMAIPQCIAECLKFRILFS